MTTSSDYCNYYESQLGGELRVFRGGVQSGAGLGDVLRGIFRFLAPIALRGLSTFASRTLTGQQLGMPLSLAAKSAIVPTISAVTGSAAPAVSRSMNGVAPSLMGSTVKAAAQPSAEGAAKQEGRGALFQGVDGIPMTDKAVKQYKRDEPGSSHQQSSKHKSAARSSKQKKKPSAKTVSFNF